MQFTIDITPELKARVDAWSRDFNQPPETLAVELLKEYFEDSDTGSEIAEKIATGKIKVYSSEEVNAEMENWLFGKC